MDQVKAQLKEAREKYELAPVKGPLRTLIIQLETQLRNMCVQHGGPGFFDALGFWEHSEVDKDGNCTRCGLCMGHLATNRDDKGFAFFNLQKEEEG